MVTGGGEPQRAEVEVKYIRLRVARMKACAARHQLTSTLFTPSFAFRLESSHDAA